jgi:hypothetical protein
MLHCHCGETIEDGLEAYIKHTRTSKAHTDWNKRAQEENDKQLRAIGLNPTDPNDRLSDHEEGDYDEPGREE